VWWIARALWLLAVLAFLLAFFKAPIGSFDLMPLGLALGFGGFLAAWP